VLGLALQELAGNIHSIDHLNLSPDLLTTAVQRYLGDGAEKAP
jgi:hypothetical protein